jgi:GNAT superfamily N-acetyltransferase
MPKKLALTIQPFAASDAQELSALIRDTLMQVNIADYPRACLLEHADNFTPERLIEASQQGPILLAQAQDKLVGSAALQGNIVSMVYVAADQIGQGVGTQLMEAIEDLARSEGVDQLILESSFTAVGFYRRLGYFEQERQSDRLIMTKAL